ncbi:MAG: SDR family NAD(P)-dependent oxidoreductase, partial [Actinobacteria bacterium]|nr:SDR family NAD(P)-dependent oxidoreductase [Actinomycetota bacterium]
LVARRADRLDALAGRLRAEHGIAVTTIPLDLAAADAAATLRADTDRLGLDVHTLVNNAGFATHGRFEVADPDRIRSEIALNVATLVALSRAYIPDLVRHGDGALVNIASTAAYQPVPSMAVYSATKAFVLSFTEALWHETRASGLRVLALSPGATRTEFFDVVGSAGGEPTGELLAEAGARPGDQGDSTAVVDRGHDSSKVRRGARRKMDERVFTDVALHLYTDLSSSSEREAS